jgi:hypothetical protein
MSPRRNRWPELDKFDRRVSEIEGRRAALAGRVAELDAEAGRAELADLEALAAWTADTSKRRPQPTVPVLKTEREETVAEAEALGLRLTEILAEKERFVEKHRGRLVKDADEATAQARERCEQLIAQLREARQELIEIREASIWAQLFPREETSHGLPAAALMAGLRAPTSHLLGLTSQVAADAVFRALEADAQILTSLVAPGQVEALGRADGRRAVWEKSAEGRAAEKQEKQAAIEAYTREWGIPPAEYPGG